MPYEVAEEISVTTEHKPGALGAVLKAVSDAGVAVRAFCAWGMGSEGTVMLVPSNAAKAKAALKKAGYKTSSRKVVVGAVPDKNGAGAKLASGAGAAKVNLDYAYASGTGKGTGVVVLGAGSSSAKLAKALK